MVSNAYQLLKLSKDSQDINEWKIRGKRKDMKKKKVQVRGLFLLILRIEGSRVTSNPY